MTGHRPDTRAQPKSRKDQHGSTRLFPLDALRGLLIVLMSLDHANHFVAQQHPSLELWGGKFPSYANALLFITRLVTHLAAPGFFFLMGVGMILFANSRQQRGWSRWAILRHLWVRGALLIALQLLVVNRAWELSPGGWEPNTYAGVLFALGGTMILGSLFLWLRPPYLLALTVVLLVGTELLHPGPNEWGKLALRPVELLLLHPGGDQQLWSNYPILPWLELVTFGMVFGNWLLQDPRQAFNRGLKLGAVFLLAFVPIRAMDGFGNIRPRAGDTWIDLFNVVKYPPSLAFTLLTTGTNLVILWLLGQANEKVQWFLEPLATLGQVPLFFYLLHLFLYAGLGLWLTPEGASLTIMYLVWILGLQALFPLCLWYGRLKHRQPANSLLRLF